MKKLDKRIAIALCVAVCGVGAARCETYTLDAYYPSPAGVYTNVTVTSTTVLARDGGNVGIGTKTPASKLSVAGGVQMGNDTSACTKAKEGTVRWDGAALSYCSPTGWKPVAGSSPNGHHYYSGWASAPIVVTAYAYCPAGERAIMGGGECHEPTSAGLGRAAIAESAAHVDYNANTHDYRPDGWRITCVKTDWQNNVAARASVICVPN